MEKWLVGTESGILLISNMDLTTNVKEATHFDKIGDAMRECVRLNNAKLGLSKFKVIPF